MSGAEWRIPLMRPRLPDAAALRPYLDAIDGNRWYSNFGPLERRFEAGLAGHFGVGEREAVCVANGTQGLSVALQSVVRVPVGYCLMPSFTFAASPHAAVSAGLEPWFVDVDERSWSLEPAVLRAMLPGLDGPVAAVMPVAPFGAPCRIEEWDAFSAETDIPVVIDAAAGFDSARAGQSPVVLSLHATKTLGVGEGGVVLCRNPGRIDRVRAGRNFGFTGDRVARVPGTNAKLSEYGAAVGLAALDEWSATRADFLRVAEIYRSVFAQVPGVEFGPGFSVGGATSTCNIVLDRPIAEATIARLRGAGIEARQWWNRGCHREPVFEGCRREPLPVTDRLVDRVVGLPFYRDLEIGQIREIRHALERALTG